MMHLDPEFLAGLQTHPAGVGVADQQIAVAMNAGAEISLAAAAGGRAGMAGQVVAPGFHKGAVKTLLKNATARTDIATSPGNLIFGTIAEGAGAIKKGFALQHHGSGGFIHV